MNPSQLKLILPRCDAAVFAPLLNACFAEFGITARDDQAAFLANVGHETGELTTFSENLNYSAEGLVKTWPSRFTPQIAASYARRPEAIANHVYAGRYGNGDEASGDGWRYRGGGGIQTTFHDNYAAGARHFSMSISDFASWVRTPEGAIRSAGWFWQSHNISSVSGNFDASCDLVNIGHRTDKVGDSIGYADRLRIFNAAKEVL